jgi:hypothetical protein
MVKWGCLEVLEPCSMLEEVGRRISESKFEDIERIEAA